MENRQGLVAAAKVVPATGTAGRETAIEMLAELQSRGQVTVGADKAYDTQEFVERLRDLNVIPHVAQNHKRRGGSAIDARTTRHAGYEVSQRIPANASRSASAGQDGRWAAADEISQNTQGRLSVKR